MDKNRLLGASPLASTPLAYGCMRISGTWDPKEVSPMHIKKGKAALEAAYEAGYRLFDHADIYASGACEEIFGEFLNERPGIRQELVIATKCGIRFAGSPNPDSPGRRDFTKKHILWSCEQSLKRLKIDAIDLYQLHRPDFLMDPTEVGEAFDELAAEGKVKAFGVSNFSPSQVSALQSGLKAKLEVNQVEIHPGRLDCFYDGTLDQCLERGMTPLAWSPLGGGLFGAGGKVPEGHEDAVRLQGLVKALDDVAQRMDADRAQVSLAWLKAHPSGIIPIVGSVNPANIRSMAQAAGLTMEREDWYRIFVASRAKPLP